VEDVIKGCKNHQHHDDREPNPKADLLRSLRQWTTAHDFNQIEQKVTAIQ
jgi:hypothetical protein